MVMTEEAEKILEMVRALPGEIGLVIRDTVTGEEISWGKDTPVVAASVIKILVMAEAFRQKEEGILDFEKRGKFVYYRLKCPCILGIIECLQTAAAT